MTEHRRPAAAAAAAAALATEAATQCAGGLDLCRGRVERQGAGGRADEAGLRAAFPRLDPPEANAGLWFDRVAADRALRFFPRVLRHSTGEWAGKPLVLAPWQAFQLASIFGWKREANKLRRFRGSYCSVARKNGKSSLAAGLGLYMLTSDKEPGAEIFSYATKSDQARIVWNEAKRMIRKSPDLAMRLKPVHSRISYGAQESWWAPLSRDNESMDGINPHLAIADELHAHKSRDAYDVINSAFGARRQPLHWVITTRGANQLNICGELDDYSCSVLRGDVHDDFWFAFIACLDERRRLGRRGGLGQGQPEPQRVGADRQAARGDGACSAPARAAERVQTEAVQPVDGVALSAGCPSTSGATCSVRSTTRSWRASRAGGRSICRAARI